MQERQHNKGKGKPRSETAPSKEGQAPNLMLPPYVILDLTDEKGSFCSRLLGDLGAEVIKIEKPGGNPERRVGPLCGNATHAQSLAWLFNNANKKGITLDVATRDGQEIFKRLVRMADVVVESFPPGYMDTLNIDYQTLKETNPRIIMTSITPFGQDGPYSLFKTSDLVSMAMSGMVFMTGEPDRPPVRVGSPQAYYHAGTHAATGTLLALRRRKLSGEGQQVDVSIRQSILLANMNALRFAEISNINVTRGGAFTFRPFTGAMHRQTWPCKDGYICYSIIGGTTGSHFQRALVAWMDSEGMAPDFLKEMDWSTLDFAHLFQEDLDRISEPILAFFATKTKAELCEGALPRGLPIFPQATAKDLLENEQLNAREFWVDVSHPELGMNLTYPGAWIKASKAPLRTWLRAPEVGEHNREIYEERLGFSGEELSLLKQAQVI